MNILAVDTSTKDLILAIKTENGICERKSKESLQHSKILFSELEELLLEGNVQKEKIDIISVNLGPGSFTGIRIGACFAKGMNYALGTKLVGVDAFVAIAEEGRDFLPAGILCEERNGGGYFAVATLTNGEVQVSNRGVYKREEIEVQMEKAGLKTILSSVKISSEKFQNEVISGVLGLINLAEKASIRGEYTIAEELEPVYIKKSQAEEQLIEKERKNTEK